MSEKQKKTNQDAGHTTYYERHRRHMVESRQAAAIGWMLTAISAVVAAFLIYLIAGSRLLPPLFTIPIIAVIAALVLICRAVLGFRRKPLKRSRYTAGIIMTCIVTLLFGAVSYAVYQPVSALRKITSDKLQTTRYGVFVVDDSPAKSINDLRNATYSVMNTPGENERVLKVEKLISADTGRETATVAYDDFYSCAKALADGDTNAMIMNSGLMTAFADASQEEAGVSDTASSGTGAEPTEAEQTAAAEEASEAAAQPPQNAISSTYDGSLHVGDRVTIPTLKTTFRCVATYDVTETVKTKEGNPDGTFTILLSGSDTRGALNSTGRNDVNILATVNPKSKTILLVNTPRDYYVPLSISNGVPDKLTHAGIYGEQVSMDTLGQLYETEVDDFFRINFVGFKDVINELGGVTVHSDYDFTTDDGHTFVKGDNTMDGDAALAFVRERHHLAGGDNQRGKDQMYVIQAIVQKMLSPAILQNYATLWESLSNDFATSVSYDRVAAIVSEQLANGGSWNIQMYAVQGTGDSRTSYSMPNQRAYVMIPDMKTVNHAKSMIDDVYAGRQVNAGE